MVKLLQPDIKFQENTLKYNWIDSLMAFGLFGIMCVLYAILAILERHYPVLTENKFASISFNILLVVLTILLVKVRKGEISSIGLCGGKWKISCIIGAGLALILFLNNCLSHIIGGASFIEIKDIMELGIYFLSVSICEEIVFRGYIGTRLFGFLKNQYLVIIITGVLFIAMHFPYRMVAYGMSIADLIIDNLGWILDLFLTHIVLSLIYVKTNSLWGSIIPHWMSNLAYNLVAR